MMVLSGTYIGFSVSFHAHHIPPSQGSSFQYQMDRWCEGLTHPYTCNQRALTEQPHIPILSQLPGRVVANIIDYKNDDLSTLTGRAGKNTPN